MMSLPYRHGFSPHQWHQVTDVMLEKQTFIPRIHRLRIITLLESDFNHAHQILLARQLGNRLEENNLVPATQNGSHPGKLCISAVLHKVLTYNITQHKRTTAAFIENDAVGCYDHMVNNFLLLGLHRLGLPKPACTSIGKSWATAKHSIRTRYGTSEIMYSSIPRNPFLGLANVLRQVHSFGYYVIAS